MYSTSIIEKNQDLSLSDKPLHLKEAFYENLNLKDFFEKRIENDFLFFSRFEQLTCLFGDPNPGKNKQIWIVYRIYGYGPFISIYEEDCGILNRDICIGIPNNIIPHYFNDRIVHKQEWLDLLRPSIEKENNLSFSGISMKDFDNLTDLGECFKSLTDIVQNVESISVSTKIEFQNELKIDIPFNVKNAYILISPYNILNLNYLSLFIKNINPDIIIPHVAFLKQKITFNKDEIKYYIVILIIKKKETIKKSSSILLTYVFYESPRSLINYNYFVNKINRTLYNIVYRLIVNTNNPETIYKEKLYFEKWNEVIIRKNEGHDFLGYYASLKYSEEKNENYDFYIFLNDTVAGPFFPEGIEFDWIGEYLSTLSDKVKLSGLSINCHTFTPHHELKQLGTSFFPHVQSMLFFTDSMGIKILYPEILNSVCLDRNNTIIKKEIGMSLKILSSGFHINSVLSLHKNRDYFTIRDQLTNFDSLYDDIWYSKAYGEYNIRYEKRDDPRRWIKNARTLHPYDGFFFKSNRNFGEKILSVLMR